MARIAFIADIHEDLVSLDKALRMIDREKCDEIVCLGDILGYPYLRGKYEQTRNAAACISLIRKYCSSVLPGNHDLFHIRKLPQFCSGFQFPSGWYDLSPDEKTRCSGGKIWNYSDDYPVTLSENETEYLMSLPEFVFRKIGEKNILWSHFVFPNFSGMQTGLDILEKK